MGTTAQKLQAILDSKAAIKDAIEEKGVTVGSASLDQYASKIGEISGGGKVPSMDDDVRFFDYDGELLYSYTKEDFAQLTEMPANPSHEGLTAQGWNWTLTDAKAYVNKYKILDIGQMYITDNGKTRLYFDLPKGALDLTLQLNLSTGGSIMIDWGDGSSPYTTSTSGNIYPEHTYAQEGKYMVAITVNSGSVSNITSRGIVPNGNSDKLVIPNSLYKVEIGQNFSLSQNAFNQGSYTGAFGLETITLPYGFTEIPVNCFVSSNLRCLVIPSSVTTLNAAMLQTCSLLKVVCLTKEPLVKSASFYSCISLERVCLPPLQEELPQNVCYACTGLKRIVVPDNVTTFSANSLTNPTSLVSFTIPHGTTTFANSFLANARSMHKLELPTTITTLPLSFLSGTWIHELVIPNNVTTLGNTVCYQCRGLSYLVIGSGVTSIGDSCFQLCISLLEVHIKPTTPPTLGSNAFGSIPSTCKIYVPQGTLNAYQTATNWSAFASYMQEEPTT